MVKWRRFKFFAQLHGNSLFLAIIYQLHKYQTLLLVNYIAFSEIKQYGLMLTGYFKILSHKVLVYAKQAFKTAILLLYFFSIFKINITFVKYFMKKKSTTCVFKVLVLHKIYCSVNSPLQNGGSLKIF